MSWNRYLLAAVLWTTSSACVAHSVPTTTGANAVANAEPPRPRVQSLPDGPSQNVLRLDNDEGVIKAYRCRLADDELTKTEPQETGCVSLGEVRPFDLQLFDETDHSCRKYGREELKILGLLAFSAASLGSAIGIVVGGFTEQFWRWGLGLGAGAALVAAVGGHYFGVNWCERGLKLVIERLYDEVQSKVPVNHTRLIFADDRTWKALDAVTSLAK